MKLPHHQQLIYRDWLIDGGSSRASTESRESEG